MPWLPPHKVAPSKFFTEVPSGCKRKRKFMLKTKLSGDTLKGHCRQILVYVVSQMVVQHLRCGAEQFLSRFNPCSTRRVSLPYMSGAACEYLLETRRLPHTECAVCAGAPNGQKSPKNRKNQRKEERQSKA